MSDQTPTPQTPSFGDRLARASLTFIRALVRILLVLLLAVLLGAGVYFGVPALYRRYIQPVETNLVRLNDAQIRQEQADLQIKQRLDELQSRLNGLEQQNDAHKQTLDELQTRLGELESAQQSNPQATASSRLDKVETSLAAVSANLEQLQSEIAHVDQAMAQTSTQVQELASQSEASSSPLNEIRNELQLLKAMEHLTRSRLYLVEDNLGLAEEEVRAARLLLAGLGGDVPPYQVETLATIVAHLDSALSELPGRPVLASEELEIAWQMLRDGLPGESTPQPTLTSGVTTGTPTPTIASGTPTPSGTP